MALDMTSFAAALKQHYTTQRIENMVYKDNPFLAMISKYESFGGENLKLPIKYGIPQGRSATFSDALANKTSSQLKAFLLTRKSNYSLADIDNETLEASKGNANAFIEAATTEIDGAIESATRSLAISLFGDGGGSIGQLDTTVAGTTITLSQADDITNFEVGMSLNLYSTATGGAIRASTASFRPSEPNAWQFESFSPSSFTLALEALSDTGSNSTVRASLRNVWT